MRWPDTASESDRSPMSRFLIIVGLALVVVGMLWPWLRRFGLGRLPGDILMQRGNFTVYVPITTCLVVSIVISVIVRLIDR